MSDCCPDCGFAFDGPGYWPFCGPFGHERVGTFSVQPDTIPGGTVIENLTPTPRRFYSRSEIRRTAELTGAVPTVRHIGIPGSDKSPHTTRWV